MTNSYSLTYASRIIAIVMALSLILGWDLDEGYITELVTSVIWIIGEIISFYGRFRAGGLKWWGARV